MLAQRDALSRCAAAEHVGAVAQGLAGDLAPALGGVGGGGALGEVERGDDRAVGELHGRGVADVVADAVAGEQDLVAEVPGGAAVVADEGAAAERAAAAAEREQDAAVVEATEIGGVLGGARDWHGCAPGAAGVVAAHERAVAVGVARDADEIIGREPAQGELAGVI